MHWGVVATIKASVHDTLNFVAYHVDLGAHRVYVYLDEPDKTLFAALKAHPKVRVTTCDDRYWEKRPRRPKKHQVRQSINATHAYQRAEVDWLAHIDVDEFLWSDLPIIDHLRALPDEANCARLYPAESLAGDGTAFKARHRFRADRSASAERLYPIYGRYLQGGFLSHVAGKLFLRTGLPGVNMRIHNMFQGDTTNPGEVPLDEITLCHRHARNWSDFIAAYRFRLERGSYRADLAPMRPAAEGGLTLHELLGTIERDQGEDGLRAFYDELFADTPEHRRRLKAEGLLRLCDLQLDRARRRQFPEFD